MKYKIDIKEMEEWVNCTRMFEKVDLKPSSTKSAFGGGKLSMKSL